MWSHYRGFPVVTAVFPSSPLPRRPLICSHWKIGFFRLRPRINVLQAYQVLIVWPFTVSPMALCSYLSFGQERDISWTTGFLLTNLPHFCSIHWWRSAVYIRSIIQMDSTLSFTARQLICVEKWCLCCFEDKCNVDCAINAWVMYMLSDWDKWWWLY